MLVLEILICSIIFDGQRASGGTSIMLKSSVPHRHFDLNTNLQAVAVNVTLSKKVTICSIYLPLSDVLSKNSFVTLIDQLHNLLCWSVTLMITVKSGVARTQMTEEKL